MTKLKIKVASAELAFTNDAGEELGVGRVVDFEYEGEGSGDSLIEGLAMLTGQLEQNAVEDQRRRRGSK